MNEHEAESLMEQGFKLLEEDDIKAAIDIADQLHEMRFSGGFEIEALAHQYNGDNHKAIVILEEGVKKAPEVWRMWQLLGNLYSDTGRYVDALRAYETGMECPEADIPNILLNRAIVLDRLEKFGEALETVSQALALIDDDTGQNLFFGLIQQKMVQLSRFERYDEAIEFGKTMLDEIEKSDYSTYISGVLSEIGNIIWISKKDKEEALGYAWSAIEWNKNDYTGQYLIREIQGQISPDAKYFRIIVEGRWHELTDDCEMIPGFFTNYDVVASTPEEALLFIKPFEPEEVRDSLRIEKCDTIGDRPNEPKGVYKAQNSYHFFPPDTE